MPSAFAAKIRRTQIDVAWIARGEDDVNRSCRTLLPARIGRNHAVESQRTGKSVEQIPRRGFSSFAFAANMHPTNAECKRIFLMSFVLMIDKMDFQWLVDFYFCGGNSRNRA